MPARDAERLAELIAALTVRLAGLGPSGPVICEGLTNEEALCLRLGELYEDIANHHLDLSRHYSARAWASIAARGGTYPSDDYWQQEADRAFWEDVTEPALKRG